MPSLWQGLEGCQGPENAHLQVPQPHEVQEVRCRKRNEVLFDPVKKAFIQILGTSTTQEQTLKYVEIQEIECKFTLTDILREKIICQHLDLNPQPSS